ncbi:MAG: caspase family protein [Methyloprofundus sp.]|nr:caspase family protein [Methyloprofundus sp.]
MREAQTGLNIVLLDACRDNPLPKGSRSSKRGLARVASPNGTIIIYSTSPGSTAADGVGRNGLFSKHLLNYIDRENLSIEKVMKNVSRAVQKESKNKQVPWMESSFTGDFYFVQK